jgi:uncharacterized membrane protein YdjX (TVP38/TMEM64 family)
MIINDGDVMRIVVYGRQDDVWLGLCLFVAVVGAMLWSWLGNIPFTDPVVWQVLFSDLGWAAHALFIVAQFVQVVVPFIPGQATGLAGGYLFGTGLGLLYTMIGTVIGSVAAYYVGNRVGRPVLLALFDEDAVRRWDDRVAEHGLPVFFAMILLPGFPDDLLCFLAGLSALRFDGYMISVVLGRLPLFALYAYAGSNPGQLWSVEGVVLTVCLGVFSSVCFVWRDELFSWLSRVV